ncbi:MAG: T9SS type A sorting domain-containing protein [Candidatus Latescibacteria bacterium]|nr:T9SS type A sorting domain-containing protein [Candidatus Latescibacterota bacterium]
MKNTPTLRRFAVLALLILLPAAFASATETARERHHEVPDDPYVASPRVEHPRSPAMRFARGSFLAVQVNVDALGQNIVGDAANEPSIAVDALDPNRMVIGWRQFDSVTNNFRQAGYGYTTDGGLTWTFPGVIEPGVFRSDPVLDSDAAGRLYYNSLTIEGNDYPCDVYRSDDGGMAWDGGVRARGGDKQWMTIDKSGGVGDGHIYAYWNGFFSTCPPGFFTRSTDGGDSYENCTTIPDDPYWGTLTVDPLGRLFTIGTNGDDFTVARSSNAQQAGQSVTWDAVTVVDLGGPIRSSTGPNPGGLLGQAHVAAIPGGPQGVVICALCSVNPAGTDPLDVGFSRSTDGGLTWSAPVRVNDDAGTGWQWFGTMSTSPSGRIDAIWLDTRDNPGTYLSSLYYSHSDDGGLTWSANERLSEAFDPHLGWPNQDKMGDYYHMVSDDQGFNLAWAATFNGEQDVYYGRMTLGATAAGDTPAAPLALLNSDPNPFTASTTLRYKVPVAGFVSLEVYDALGRRVATLVSDEKQAGAYEAQLDAQALPGGIYFARLHAGEFGDTKKLLHLR